MKKKLLIEKLAALRTEYGELLAGAATAPDAVVHLAVCDGKESELNTAQAELFAIESLEAKARANVGRIPPTTHDNAQDKPFRDSVAFFSAVIAAGKSAFDGGGPIDPRLQNLASGANESIASEGGFLVDSDTASGLMERVYAVGTLARKCYQVPISANANGTKINGVDETSRATGSRYGGIQSYWASEASTVTASQPKFRRIELNLKKLFALAYATEEQLVDGPQLQSFIETNMPNEIAFRLDDAILNGNGAGLPLGVLASGAYVSQAAEGGQTATTFNAANVSKMFGRMWSGSMGKAEWYMNQDVWQQLPQMVLANMPIYAPNFAVSPYGSLFGKPINIIEHAATLGTLGDVSLMDLSQYALATKGGVKSAMSMHVRFIYDESVFKFTLRVDGQPTWNAPLTPFKGSATQSPFVFLAAR